MTLTEARDFLRAELLAAAAAAVPGHEGVVTQDAGPVNPDVLSDGDGPATVCSVTVENGHSSLVDPTGQLAAAVAALETRGWQTSVPPAEPPHHRATATRDGYHITIHTWDTDWRITLSGETPHL